MNETSGVPGGTDKRGVRAVLFALLGFVAGTAFTVVALRTLNPSVFDTHPEDDGGGVMTPSDPGGGMAMDIQAVLEHHIPADVMGTCRSVAPDDLPDSIRDAVYASDECMEPAPGVQQVVYHSLHDGIAMRALFETAEGEAAPFGDGGDCHDGAAWTGRWQSPPDIGTPLVGVVMHTLVAGERIHRDSLPTGTTTGRVVCFVNAEGNHEIAWYDNDTHIYAAATASAENQSTLFRWWTEMAGPYHPRGTEHPDPSPAPASASPSSMPSEDM